MVVSYLTNGEKERYFKSFPFLRDVVGGATIKIDLIKCDKFPEPIKGNEGSNSDTYYYKTYNFKGSCFEYQLHETELIIDYDSDDISPIVDYEYELYMRRTGWKFTESVKPVDNPEKRLVLLSGPSGVGKGPLMDAMIKEYFWHKEPMYFKAKVQKSWSERYVGDGSDVLDSDKAAELRKRNPVEIKCRGTDQLIDIDEIDEAFKKYDVVLIEAYHDALGPLRRIYEEKVDFKSVFLSPLSCDDLTDLIRKDIKVEDYLPSLMFDSLIKRAALDGKAVTFKLGSELKKRAEDSCNEMQSVPKYDYVIHNACFESDPRWRILDNKGKPVIIGAIKNSVKALGEIATRGMTVFADKGGDYCIIDVFNKYLFNGHSGSSSNWW